jgi:hypothetical protein
VVSICIGCSLSGTEGLQHVLACQKRSQCYNPLNPFESSMHLFMQRISQKGCSICRLSSGKVRLSIG